MKTPRLTKPATVTPFDVATRRNLAAALDRAESGHPKPELVRKLAAELEAYDRANPAVRAAIGRVVL